MPIFLLSANVLLPKFIALSTNSHNYFSSYNLALPKIYNAEREIYLKPRNDHVTPCLQMFSSLKSLSGKGPKNKNYPKANHLDAESKFMRTGTLSPSLFYHQHGE